MAVHAVESDDEPVNQIDTLTAFETSQAERKAGQSITTLGSDTYPQVALIGALGWVHAKRKEPTLTYDSYMRNNTVDSITRQLGLGGTTDTGDEDEEGKDADDDSPS